MIENALVSDKCNRSTGLDTGPLQRYSRPINFEVTVCTFCLLKHFQNNTLSRVKLTLVQTTVL